MSQNYFNDNIYNYDGIRQKLVSEISYNFTEENVLFDRFFDQVIGNGSSNIFGKRFGHQVTEYANRIFVIGGTEIDLQNTRATHFNVMNDIWGSANGKTWIKYEIDNSEWFIEDYSQKPNNFFSIKNTDEGYENLKDFQFPKITNSQIIGTSKGICIIGGLIKNTYDGIQPNRTNKYIFDNDSPLIKPNDKSQKHKPIVDNINKLIIRLEFNGFKFIPHIMITNFIGISNITNHKCIKLNNSVYLFNYNSVWKTSNYSKWNNLIPLRINTQNNQFSYRRDYEVITLNNTFYVLGGNDGNKTLNDIWSSTDGVNWRKIKDEAEWSPRYLHKCCNVTNGISLDGDTSNELKYIVLIGGKNFQIADTKTIVMSYNDIWYSQDGINWKESGVKISHRNNVATCDFRNKGVIIGGCYDVLLEYASDTWAIDAYNDVFIVGEDPGIERFEMVPVVGSIQMVNGTTNIPIGRTICTWDEYKQKYEQYIRKEYRPPEINGNYDENGYNPKSILQKIT